MLHVLSLLSLHHSCFPWQMTGSFDICWWSNTASQAKSNRVKCEKYSCWLYFLLIRLTLNRSASTRKPRVNHSQILLMIFAGLVAWTWTQSTLCLPGRNELAFSLEKKCICVWRILRYILLLYSWYQRYSWHQKTVPYGRGYCI